MRVADHATNIAEDVIFWVQGADVRHNVIAEEASPSGATAGDESVGAVEGVYQGFASAMPSMDRVTIGRHIT